MRLSLTRQPSRLTGRMTAFATASSCHLQDLRFIASGVSFQKSNVAIDYLKAAL